MSYPLHLDDRIPEEDATARAEAVTELLRTSKRVTEAERVMPSGAAPGGVVLFVLSMFVCCTSSLLGKPAMTHQQLTTIGWNLGSNRSDGPSYSAQRAIVACLLAAVFFGLESGIWIFSWCWMRGKSGRGLLRTGVL